MKKPSQPITGRLAMAILADLKRGDSHQHQIAAKYDINPGRISETKHGQYNDLIEAEKNQLSLF